ncbi:MAG TPA: hypothetical protein VIM96_06735 [Pseudomonadales bacterium]
MTSYGAAWLVYTVSAAGALLALHRLMSYRYLKPLRIPVLLLSAAIILMPVHMPERPGWYAPAVMGAGIQLLDEGAEAMWALLESPVFVGLFLVALWGVGCLIRYALKRRKTASPINEEPVQEPKHEV